LGKFLFHFVLIEKIDLMKKAILARAFRCELGTNDPREESAAGLLWEALVVSGK
jgi:type I restriction enzyme S subunit